MMDSAVMAGMTGIAAGILNIVLTNVGRASDDIFSGAVRAANGRLTLQEISSASHRGL